MSMRKVCLFGSLLLCAALSACSPAKPTVTKLEAKDSGSTVHMKVDDTLEISLEGNTSTGYTWEALPDLGALLAQQGDGKYVANSAVGSGGVMTFTFKAVQPGSSGLQLIYHRPFAPTEPPSQTFDLNIVVDE